MDARLEGPSSENLRSISRDPARGRSSHSGLPELRRRAFEGAQRPQLSHRQSASGGFRPSYAAGLIHNTRNRHELPSSPAIRRDRIALQLPESEPAHRGLELQLSEKIRPVTADNGGHE